MSYKILLIDPDASHVAALERPLADAGYDVVTAGDRDAGLRAIEDERPDLALVEAFLPSDEALELCQELKTGGDGRRIPVVILSDPESELAPEFADLKGFGCDEYVRLPLEDEDLIAMCARLLADAGPAAAFGAFDADDGFDAALDDLGAELEAAADLEVEEPADIEADAEAEPEDRLADEAYEADEAAVVDDHDESEASRAQAEADPDPDIDADTDTDTDTDGAEVLRFQSMEPGLDVPDSLRESLRELQEEESRLDGFLQHRSPDGSMLRRPSVLGMDAIVEQLESTKAPEPLRGPLRPIGAEAEEEPRAETAAAEVAGAEAPPAGPAEPTGDPFSGTDEIGAHIDSLFGSDPQTPVAEPAAAPPGDAPELIGIDSDLVAWDSASPADETPPRQEPTAPTVVPDPFGAGAGAASGRIAPAMDDDVIPGAEPFRPHVEIGGEPEELAVDGMDEPSGSSGTTGWIVAAVLLVVIGGGAALWLLPDAPTPPEPGPDAAAAAGAPAPTPQPRAALPTTDPTIFDVALAEPGAADAILGGARPERAADEAIAAPEDTAPPAEAAVRLKPAAKPKPATVAKPAPKSTSVAAAKPRPVVKPKPKPTPEPEPTARTSAPEPVNQYRKELATQPPASRDPEPTSTPERYAQMAQELASDTGSQPRGTGAAEPAEAGTGTIRLPGRLIDPLVQYGRGDASPVDSDLDVTGVDFVAPALADRPEPEFPAELVAERRGSTVLLRVRVNERGQVTRIVVEEGRRGDPLTALSIDAVLRSTYDPATAAGRPVRAWITERFSF